ncbi:MAG: hypothetical protein IJG37_08340 [Synergistaceae bacterium]|nr:hypothetical protein [Synergistaceae bacterium]
MMKFYGRTYSYRGKVIGVCSFLCNKLFTIGTYDPSTEECVRYKPIFTDAAEGQSKLDEFAQEEGLTEVSA